jgi:hypothetical protein
VPIIHVWIVTELGRTQQICANSNVRIGSSWGVGLCLGLLLLVGSLVEWSFDEAVG